ncbi:hypothetical protein BN1723_003966, partial [Verticillium longisporum]
MLHPSVTPAMLSSSTWTHVARRQCRRFLLSSPPSCITLLRSVASPRRSVRMASTLPKLPIFEAIASHDPHSTAVIHSLSGRRFQYGELLGDVRRARDELQAAAGKLALDGERIAFLVENSYDYVVTLLAALAARSIAVPLSPAFPAAELQYILNQSEASLLVSSSKFSAKARHVLATELASKPAQLELQKHMGGAAHEAVQLEGSDPSDAGMMLYTSGTTNRPKGVLLPQSVLTAQSKSLIEAWEYTPQDHLLHVLPLHHIHGTINALLTPLFAGSTIEFLFPFNPDASLLFGASNEQMKILIEQDDTLINEEGFGRTRLRAEYINLFLKGRAPPLFWEQVDETAIGITRAFLPVIAWIRKTRIDEVASIGEIHQQIHGIVAFTAWLAVCMRRSVSIIEFDWPTPGECDLPSSNTENFDDWVYRKALKRVEQYGRKRGSHKPRRARVMIAIAPSAWRYTLSPDGYWKVRLQQKRAVYYHGLQDDMDEKKEHRIGLSEWAAKQRAEGEGD